MAGGELLSAEFFWKSPIYTLTKLKKIPEYTILLLIFII